MARGGDPETSWQAAASVQDIRGSQQQVLDLFHRHGPMADEDLAESATADGIVQSSSGLRTRRSELAHLGLVTDTGHRAWTRAGRRTIVWEAAASPPCRPQPQE